jgi:hypothetical protein
MNPHSIKFVIILFLVLTIAGCKSDLNSPDGLTADAMELYKFETVESDLALLKGGGMPLPDGDAVFSIGWNEMFRPFNDDSQIKGMAFAVAFGDENTESTNFPRFGLDMGIINIGYSGNQIQMHKMFHPRRGTAYSLFNRPFGGSDILLEYQPSTEYTFEVSGSENFSAATITLLSPASLIDITSHSHSDIIDPQQNLTITWTGGNATGKIALRVMPHFKPQRVIGMGGKHNPGNPPPTGPHPGRAIVVILDNNPGQYKFIAEQIQNIISEFGADKIVIDISQFELGEVEHDDKVLHTAMRNGTSVMLNVQ